jgi:hypothetical protein
MEPPDHLNTSSHGSKGLAGAQYRSQVEDLIKQGKMRDAMALEIKDVRRIAGVKYNQAIREMSDYAKSWAG